MQHHLSLKLLGKKIAPMQNAVQSFVQMILQKNDSGAEICAEPFAEAEADRHAEFYAERMAKNLHALRLLTYPSQTLKNSCHFSFPIMQEIRVKI